MRNKKAWIRIVEAFIAVLLISVILLTVYISKPKKTSSEEIIKIEDSLLEEISQNSGYRNDIIVSEYTGNIENFIKTKIPGNLNFTVRICGTELTCSIDVYQKEVYVRDRIFSSTLHEYEPKRLRIFMWEK